MYILQLFKNYLNIIKKFNPNKTLQMLRENVNKENKFA